MYAYGSRSSGLTGNQLKLIGIAAVLIDNLGAVVIQGVILRGGSPELYQAAVAQYIREGQYEPHLRRMRQIFEERRNYLLEVCRREFGDWGVFSSGEQGMHVVFTFKNQNIDDHAVQRLCLEQGVETRHLSSFYHEQPPLKGLVLGFGFFNESQILSAVSRIGFVLRHNFSAWA